MQPFLPSPPTAPHPYSYFEHIDKPDNDERKYRLVRLQNQLTALIIHDPETDKASAALDVKVGSLSDPKELQGLAHLCEHLLFMGTDKYPEENAYDRYLEDHGGYANAYTSLENTNYHFEVGYKHFDGALDRLAQFFIAPRFDPNSMEREILAVDSENKENLQSDVDRLDQLQKTLCRPNHPYSNFDTGNLETLKHGPERSGLDIRNEVLKFHGRYYSANVMRLVVLGKESLDELTNSVVEKFSPVVNKNVEVPVWPGSPLGPSELMRQINARPIKDIRSLEVTWPLPDEENMYRSQPSQYASHLIGHEGPGSVLSLLKKKGWLNALTAGTDGGARGFDFFSVHMDLTEAGLENYENIVEILFMYIELIKRSGVQEHLFNEVKDLSVLSFRFRGKSAASQYTSHLAASLQKPYPENWVLSGSRVIREFNLEAIQDCLAHLDHENFQILVVSNSFAAEGMAKEKWYGTEHKVQPVCEELRKRLKDVASGKVTNEELRLPSPNLFIATNFDTGKTVVDLPQIAPKLLLSTPIARLWHKKDDTFWVPKASTTFLLRNPLAYASVRNSVMTRLLAELVEDALTEYAYDAEVAGVQYYLNGRREGLMLSLGGYNDKMDILLEKVLQKMKGFEVDGERFELIKESLGRRYKDTELDSPMQQAAYYMTHAHQERSYTPMQKWSELQVIGVEDVQQFVSHLLSHMHIEALVTGNVKSEKALELMGTVQKVLNPKPVILAELMPYRSVLLPKGKQFVYQKNVADEKNVNSAIEYYCGVGDATDFQKRALLSLLAQVTTEPCFNQLRTKEQLGYVVLSGVRKHTTTIGMRFSIQSEKNTVYLEKRIEAFLNQLHGIIENLAPEEFSKHVESVVALYREKLKNLGQESRRFWGHIHSGYYNFHSIEKTVVELRMLAQSDLVRFFLDYVHPSSPSRTKLSVHLQSQVPPKIPRAAIDITKLHTCLTSHGFSLKVEDLRTAIKAGSEDMKDVLQKLLNSEECDVDKTRVARKLKNVSEAVTAAISTCTDLGHPDVLSGRLTNADLPKGNEIVVDLMRFKLEECQLSKAPKPMVALELDMTSTSPKQ